MGFTIDYPNTKYGLDTTPPFNDGTDIIDSSVSNTSVSVEKLSDGGGPNTDANVLDPGDIINITGSVVPEGEYTYEGTIGATGDLIASNADYRIWISDTQTFVTNLTNIPTGPDIDNDLIICFAEGTRITVIGGTRAVENLTIGDEIITADGRAVPIKWIGRQTVHKLFTRAERFKPVRISAGALAEGVPHSDLTVTADHAMILDGIAVNASALVNGTTIIRVPMDELAETETYYHIETENHEVVLANGAAAETYVDAVSRRVFDNYAEYVELYGEEIGRIEELDMLRCMSRRQLPHRIREHTEIRAVALRASDEQVA